MKTKPDYLGMGMLAAVFAAYAAVYFNIGSKGQPVQNDIPPTLNIGFEDLFHFGR